MKRMTVTLVVGLFALMLALPRSAAADIQFGIKVGGNIAKITGSDVSNIEGTLKSKVGFVGGVFLAFNIGRIITIQPEINYTMKGAERTYTDSDITYNEKLYSNYIEIPVLLKIRIPIPGISPVVFAGPAVGYKLNEKATLDGVNETLVNEMFEKLDYGAIFGAGLDFGRHFMLDVRYSLGMEKVVKAIEGETSANIKNGVWSASIGFAF